MEARRKREAELLDSFRAAGFGHFIRSDEDKETRAKKRAALIDTLRMDYTCAFCDRRFALLMYHWPRDHNWDYCRFSWTCSEACAVALRRQRARQPLPERPCLACGEPFVPSRTDARFCSNACRQRAHRRRVRIEARP